MLNLLNREYPAKARKPERLTFMCLGGGRLWCYWCFLLRSKPQSYAWHKPRDKMWPCSQLWKAPVRLVTADCKEILRVASSSGWGNGQDNEQADNGSLKSKQATPLPTPVWVHMKTNWEILLMEYRIESASFLLDFTHTPVSLASIFHLYTRRPKETHVCIQSLAPDQHPTQLHLPVFYLLYQKLRMMRRRKNIWENRDKEGKTWSPQAALSRVTCT